MATAAKRDLAPANDLPDTLAFAMAAAFAEFEAAAKTANNPHFKSKYADLTSVMDAVKPALINHGLFFTQATHDAEHGVCIETVIHHRSGESYSCGRLFVPAGKQDAQGFGSALTYARRYSLMTAFGIPAEDDDGNAAARSAPANDHRGPAPRTKLEGHFSSKTALKKAIHELHGKVAVASSTDEVDSILKAARATINQAEHDWPELLSGDPAIPEDTGLKGAVALRREQLTAPAEEGMYSMLIDSMKQCDTRSMLTGWMTANEPVIDALDDADRRRFEAEYDKHEAGIGAMDRVTAGA